MAIALEMFTKTFHSKNSYRSTSSNKELDIYIQHTFHLADSLVIKSEDAGKLSDLLLMNLFDSRYGKNEPPENWKYYLNLNGEYHPLLDKMMYINSIDTLEQIEFTKANMDIHKNTRDDLIKNHSAFRKLVGRYPIYEVLIRGILNPVPLDVSINAKDGQILYYPSHLIEHNEYTLIDDLGTWIYNFKGRWNIGGYLHTDELYVASHLGLLYINIPNAIMNLREDRIHSLEVHSFHVRQYLASHGLIDRYLNWMDFYQSLFLYRNIKYLKKHAGHAKSFNMIVKHILDHRRIPLDGLLTNLVAMDSDIDVQFSRKPYTENSSSVGPSHLSLNRYINKEIGILETNSTVRRKHKTDALDRSKYGRMKSKMLDSSAIDYNSSDVYPLLNILYNHWAYLSLTDKYKTFIEITNREEGTTLTVSTRDAFVLSMIIVNDMLKTPMLTIPKRVMVELVQVKASVNPDTYKNMLTGYTRELMDGINFINSNISMVDAYISRISFYESMIRVYTGYKRILKYIYKVEYAPLRSMLKIILSTVFTYKELELPEGGTLVSDWEINTKIKIRPEDNNNQAFLLNELIEKSTGYNPTDFIDLPKIQKSSIGILKQLSSYSIQVSESINTDPIAIADWSYDRVTSINATTDDSYDALSWTDSVEARSNYTERYNTSKIKNHGSYVDNSVIKCYFSMYISTRLPKRYVHCPRGRKANITRAFSSIGTMSGGWIDLSSITEEDLANIKSIY
jgi:hypothetical protein